MSSTRNDLVGAGLSSLVSEFYSELKKIAHTHNKPINNAFVYWYVKTRFGDKDYENSLITDGPYDGGIDAIIGLRSTQRTFVIQSKFHENFFKNPAKAPSSLGQGTYSEFDRLPETLKDSKKFNSWLKTVDASLRTYYKMLHELCKNPHHTVVWFATTTHSRSRAGENRLHNLSPTNFQYCGDNLRLYQLSKEGAAPPADPIKLRFSEHFIVDDQQLKIKSYVLQSKVTDFIEYLDTDPNFRLLARNVRSDLNSDINDNIRDTYENEPETLWYSHNGITMICERAEMEGKTIRLIGPNVINGAQTLHALRKASKRNPDAVILVRIVVVPESLAKEKTFINKIIFRTNQQNKMYTYDLRANDLLQVEIANEFAKRKVFYERRRKEYDLNKRVLKNQGVVRLKSTELAQILMTCERSLGGVAAAKKSLEDLFRDKFYSNLFDRQFSEIYFKYLLRDFIWETTWGISKRGLKGRQRNHPLLTCLSIAWVCAYHSRSLPTWQEKIMVTPDRLSANNKSTRLLKQVIEEIFLACWDKWKVENKKDEDLTANNFFKSQKWNESLLKTLVPRFTKKVEKALEFALQ